MVAFNDHASFNSLRQYRYKAVDDEEWGEAITQLADNWHVRLPWGFTPPTTGDNPGEYEVQLRAKCTPNEEFTEWSVATRASASAPPIFVEHRKGKPLPDDSKFCRFVEGRVTAGKAGSGCRILGHDVNPDETLTLTVGGPDGHLFDVAEDTEYVERTGTGVGESGGEWYVREREDHWHVESRHRLQFNAPPDLEAPSHPNGLYRVTFTLTDEYGQFTTGDWTITVQDLDEVENWTLSTATPKVGETVTATVTGGDTLSELDFLWESSADVTPRQWRRIPDTEQASYTPDSADAGQWLRVIVRYTDVGGAKAVEIAAAGMVTGNQAPSFPASAGTRMFAENSLPDTPVGAPIAATDTAGDVLTYTLGGADGAAFTIDTATGQLRTVAGVDYDFDAVPPKTSFAVRVTATDQADATAAVDVVITLDNVVENGTISGLTTAQVGQELTPTLTDSGGTGIPANERWQWQESAAGTPWTDLPAGNYQNYVPQAAQINRRLRVTVTYDTGDVNRRQYAEQVVSGNVVAATDGTITAPAQLSFTLAENRSGGTPVRLGPLGISSSGITSGELTRTIDAGDNTKFTLAEDVLQYVGMGENYEALSEPQEYRLRIKAVHSGVVAYSEVTVTITNVDEPGTVSITEPTTLRPGLPLTATLTDDDGPEDPQWQWQERAEGDAGWRSIAGATYPEFVPWAVQALIPNNRLRAVVRYMDGESDGDRRMVASEPTGVLQEATADTLRVNQPYLQVRLPERVAAYASTRERTLLHSFLPLGEDGRPAVPRAPVFRGLHDETDDYDCNSQDYCWVNENYRLRAASEYTYDIIDGNAAKRFEIDARGNLYYVGYGEDYEARMPAADEPQYRLRVAVRRGDERFHATVLVVVANEDDPGTMTVTPTVPTVGVALTAVVTDPDAMDGRLQNLAWGWGCVETASDGAETLRPLAGASGNQYVPTAADADAGCRLVASATYNDPQAPAQRWVERRMATPVAVASGGTPPPVFPATPTAIPDTDPEEPELAHYIVPADTLMENRSAATNAINLVMVAAANSNNDPVTYSLPSDTPAGFSVNANSGQLTYAGTGVDFEQRNVYLLTVIASVGRGDERSQAVASVYVPVGDVDEAETVVLTTVGSDGQPLSSPETGTPVVARLHGGDRVYTRSFFTATEPGTYRGTGVTWQWQRGTGGQPHGWQDIAGATAATYTPTTADANEYLQATARYHDAPNWDPADPSGSQQTASGHSTTAVYAVVPLVVEALTVNAAPIYPRTFVEGNEIRVTASFSQPVQLDGELSVTLVFVDGDERVTRAATRTGDGTGTMSTLTLTYTVALGDAAADGIHVPANSLTLNTGATLQDPRAEQDSRLERDADLAHPAYTIPASVQTLATDFPDVNHDGAVNGADGLIMYYAAVHRAELGDGTAGSLPRAAPLRATLLHPFLKAGVPETDASTLQLLRSAHVLFTHGASSALNLNGDAKVDRSDVHAIYYALQFPELVGDGHTQSGFDEFRRRLLRHGLAAGTPLNQDNLKVLVTAIQSLTRP